MNLSLILSFYLVYFSFTFRLFFVHFSLRFDFQNPNSAIPESVNRPFEERKQAFASFLFARRESHSGLLGNQFIKTWFWN